MAGIGDAGVIHQDIALSGDFNALAGVGESEVIIEPVKRTCDAISTPTAAPCGITRQIVRVGLDQESKRRISAGIVADEDIAGSIGDTDCGAAVGVGAVVGQVIGVGCRCDEDTCCAVR